jgi:hypothetical protein
MLPIGFINHGVLNRKLLSLLHPRHLSPENRKFADAAMGERAECVMLNKGPYSVTSVCVLEDILRRMQDHQEKKHSMLR